MDTVSHTPTPYHIRHTFNIFSGERLIATCGGHQDNRRPVENDAENQANAEFIVRGCNHFDEVLAALQHLVRDIEAREKRTGILQLGTAIDEAREALAKIEGGV